MANPFGSAFAQMSGALDAQANSRINRQVALDSNRRANTKLAIDADMSGYDVEGHRTAYGEQLNDTRLAKAKALQQEMMLKGKQAWMGNQAADVQVEMIKKVQEQTLQQLAQVQDKEATDAMTKTLVLAAQGKVEDAKVVISNSPALKSRLSQIGITDVAAIDWTHDKHLFQDIPNTNFSDENLNDPKIRTALDSAYIKVRDEQGNWHMQATEQLLHESNTKKYLTPTENEWLRDRYGKIANIINGAVVFDPKGIHSEADKRSMELFGVPIAKAGVGERKEVFRLIKQNQLKRQVESLAMSNPEVYAKAVAANGEANYEAILKYASEVSKGTLRVGINKQKAEDTASAQVQAAKEKEQIKGSIAINDSLKQKVIQGKELTPEEMNEINIKSGHVKDKISTKSKEDVDKKVATIKAVDRAVSHIEESLKNKKYKGQGWLNNFVTQAKNIVKGAVADKKISSDVADVSQEALTKLADGKYTIKKGKTQEQIDTETGMILAQFIYDVSGAAVTEEERKFYRGIVLGGTWSNTNELMMRIKEFGEVTSNRVKDITDTWITGGHYKEAYAPRRELFGKSGNTLDIINTADGTNMRTGKPARKPLSSYVGI